MFINSFRKGHFALLLAAAAVFLAGCISPKDKIEQATLLESADATEAELVSQIDNISKVDSMHAKVYLKFEDNSFAELGIAEKYKTAGGEITVQRPSNIRLKVEVPIVGTDVAQMASDGKSFQVAVLQDGGSGKYKKFVIGSNSADYSALQEQVDDLSNGSSEMKKNVNAFSNLRPQHFTEAMLVRPVDTSSYFYTLSTILQEEFDINAKKKSPLRWVLRGYYLYDEYQRGDDNSLSIKRRFWFDRVGGVRLARLQIFDGSGEIESDIIYGAEGALTESGTFVLPLQVELTRPKEKYKMRLTYQTPKKVIIGNEFPTKAFTLENVWGLEVLDLDKELREANTAGTGGTGAERTGRQ
ncbi:MAG: hypothetical protein DWQ47_01265 [Acidobacteria bacterium]|nr:MAG: hypothetical protein DWQ32_11725 [Acidobacteriota bacterium]REK04130.1 MAG: hypothetical protein DWQ38_01250 [Acidobacteriota bacterium]REK15292.1 MAG: hypothetical protein DWQ43_17415 [Acidobacteriota bacterium]REK46382.1 MAG: hypothetical protein DWQ47_01265 [Acidobacteriota bacterium]